GAGDPGDLSPDPEATDPAEEAGLTLREQAVRAALGKLPELERQGLELRLASTGSRGRWTGSSGSSGSPGRSRESWSRRHSLGSNASWKASSKSMRTTSRTR